MKLGNSGGNEQSLKHSLKTYKETVTQHVGSPLTPLACGLKLILWSPLRIQGFKADMCWSQLAPDSQPYLFLCQLFLQTNLWWVCSEHGDQQKLYVGTVFFILYFFFFPLYLSTSLLLLFKNIGLLFKSKF